MDEEEQRGSTEIAIPKWLPTFADMMTLLMCFFVLLLTFAEMDIKRYEQIAGSMSEAFGVQRRIVAESVPMVLPWKEFFMETMVCLPAPNFSRACFRASLIAASLASAPLLQKKTRSAKEFSTRSRARSTWGLV